MLPNSNEHKILGIVEVNVYGQLTSEDERIIYSLFDDCQESDGLLQVSLGHQIIKLMESSQYKVEVILDRHNQEKKNKQISLGFSNH